MSIIEVKSLKQFHDMISSSKHTLLLWIKPWCPYCALMEGRYKEVAASGMFKKVAFAIVDLEEQKEIAEEVEIIGIPKADLFRNGKRIARIEGLTEQGEFEAWLLRTINEKSDPVAVHRLDKLGLMSRSTETLPSYACKSQAMCIGKFEDRRKRPLIFPKNRKAFVDLEPNCVFQPTEGDNGILIGRANDDASYFDIILWNSPQDNPGKVYFSIDFMPDPVKKARFESAVFQVTVAEDSADESHSPLTIHDLYPTDEDDMVDRSVFMSGPEDGDAVPEDDALSVFSSIYEGSRPRGRNTTTTVRGHGINSPTAAWTFTVRDSPSARYGLAAHYDMYITLPTTKRVWLQFTSKAVLVKGEERKHKTTLRIGTIEKPYERIMDLSAVLRSA
ncbi:unnamed protein product [Somion occarium]|uniref:Thioredoxin domain-containing protein n=1 Tax=Somion occarium TaxID=3059160 RepID=A0ABP1D7K6_9APHY